MFVDSGDGVQQPGRPLERDRAHAVRPQARRRPPRLVVDRRGPARPPADRRARGGQRRRQPGVVAAAGRLRATRPPRAAHQRHPLRRAALPLELQLPRRGQPPRGVGGRGRPPGPRGPGPHRPRRVLRRGPLRRGRPGGGRAHRVRRRAVAGPDPPAERRGRPRGRPPAGAGLRSRGLRPAGVHAQRCAPGWPREGQARLLGGRLGGGARWPLAGAHRVSQGRGPPGAGGRRAVGGGARAGAAGRHLRRRQRGGRAVRPRPPARLGPQRCTRHPGRAGRAGAGGHQQRPLRHARPAPARHRAGRRAGPAQPRRPRRLAAGGGVGAPAVGRRAGPAFRPLARGGRVGGRAGAGVCLRSGAGGAAAAALPVPRRARRDGLPAPPRRGGRRAPLRAARRRRPSWRPRPQPEGVGPDRPRAGGHRGAGLPRLLPGGVGHRGVLPPVRHLLPGSGQRRQLGGLLRAGHHQRRRRVSRPVVRALPVARARRSARHRHRHRERSSGRGHPVRLPAPRPPARRPGGQRHQLPGPLGGARHGQGARLLARPAGRLVQADGHVVDRVVDGWRDRARHPRRRAGPGARHRAGAPPPGHPLGGHGHLRPAHRRGVPCRVGPLLGQGVAARRHAPHRRHGPRRRPGA